MKVCHGAVRYDGVSDGVSDGGVRYGGVRYGSVS